MSIRSTLFRLHRQRRQERRDMREWARRAHAAPVPMHVKRSAVLRLGIPGATWIETGTYLGDTTALLARHGLAVISIEPAVELAARAAERFRATPSVRIVPGTSEDRLAAELAGVQGDVNFWLDGHYSGGPTYRGASECPVTSELACIADARARLGRIVVLIDGRGCSAAAPRATPTIHHSTISCAGPARTGLSGMWSTTSSSHEPRTSRSPWWIGTPEAPRRIQAQTWRRAR